MTNPRPDKDNTGAPAEGGSPLSALWEEVFASILEENRDNVLLRLTLSGLKPVSFDEKRAGFWHPSRFYALMAEQHFIPLITDHFEKITGLRPEIVIDRPDETPQTRAEAELRSLGDRTPDTVDGGGEDEKKAPSEIIREAMEAGFPDPRGGHAGPSEKKPDQGGIPSLSAAGASSNPIHRSEYTFENFIVGNSNKFAHAAALGVASDPGKRYNPLFIYGDSGLGKTHLLYAITNKVSKEHPTYRQIYIKSEEFTNEMIQAIGKGTTQAFRDKYRRADLLLIDDIQFIAGRDATQEEFFHTFNTLYEDHKQIIITSDRPPRDIKTLEERLRTRFEWGLIADIKAPDYELRIAIMQNKAQAMNLTIPKSVYEYLSSNLVDNVRQLEGAIKKIAAQSYLTREPITLELAQDCVADMIRGPKGEDISVDRIIKAVSVKYGVSEDDIRSGRRSREIAGARNISMYVARRLTDMSFPQIASEFGRDHTTVMSNIKSVESRIKADSTFEKEIIDLMEEIKG